MDGPPTQRERPADIMNDIRLDFVRGCRSLTRLPSRSPTPLARLRSSPPSGLESVHSAKTHKDAHDRRSTHP